MASARASLGTSWRVGASVLTVADTVLRRRGSERRPVAPSAAFATLYDTHHRALFHLALLLTGGERELAEDAVSEAFARTFPKWVNGGVEDPGAYLRRAVVNQLHSAFRRRLLERRREERAPAPEPVPTRGHDRVTDRAVLWKALRTLPRTQRAAVVLRHYEDLSEAETARVLGISVGTVKSQTSRGLARLRTALGGEADG